MSNEVSRIVSGGRGDVIFFFISDSASACSLLSSGDNSSCTMFFLFVFFLCKLFSTFLYKQINSRYHILKAKSFRMNDEQNGKNPTELDCKNSKFISTQQNIFFFLHLLSNKNLNRRF